MISPLPIILIVNLTAKSKPNSHVNQKPND